MQSFCTRNRSAWYKAPLCTQYPVSGCKRKGKHKEKGKKIDFIAQILLMFPGNCSMIYMYVYIYTYIYIIEQFPGNISRIWAIKSIFFPFSLCFPFLLHPLTGYCVQRGALYQALLFLVQNDCTQHFSLAGCVQKFCPHHHTSEMLRPALQSGAASSTAMPNPRELCPPHWREPYKAAPLTACSRQHVL